MIQLKNIMENEIICCLKEIESERRQWQIGGKAINHPQNVTQFAILFHTSRVVCNLLQLPYTRQSLSHNMSKGIQLICGRTYWFFCSWCSWKTKGRCDDDEVALIIYFYHARRTWIIKLLSRQSWMTLKCFDFTSDASYRGAIKSITSVVKFMSGELFSDFISQNVKIHFSTAKMILIDF